MPPKKERKKGGRGGKKALTKTKDVAPCGVITPGPQYKLKTLIGYKGHCISKLRNPAYTLGGPRIGFKAAESPGPKYKFKERKRVGFSFGLAAIRRDSTIGPGPKYKLPSILHGPYFSVKSRTKPRKSGDTPAPYRVKPLRDAPAYSLGLLTVPIEPSPTPGPSYKPCNLEKIKPRSPKYSMGRKRSMQYTTASPGPKYAVMPPKPTPIYSFGTRHSKCAPPYITECDEQC